MLTHNETVIVACDNKTGDIFLIGDERFVDNEYDLILQKDNALTIAKIVNNKLEIISDDFDFAIVRFGGTLYDDLSKKMVEKQINKQKEILKDNFLKC